MESGRTIFWFGREENLWKSDYNQEMEMGILPGPPGFGCHTNCHHYIPLWWGVSIFLLHLTLARGGVSAMSLAFVSVSVSHCDRVSVNQAESVSVMQCGRVSVSHAVWQSQCQSCSVAESASFRQCDRVNVSQAV